MSFLCFFCAFLTIALLEKIKSFQKLIVPHAISLGENFNFLIEISKNIGKRETSNKNNNNSRRPGVVANNDNLIAFQFFMSYSKAELLIMSNSLLLLTFRYRHPMTLAWCDGKQFVMFFIFTIRMGSHNSADVNIIFFQ